MRRLAPLLCIGLVLLAARVVAADDVDAAVQQLKHADPAVRGRAASTLGGYADPALRRRILRPLTRTLTDPHPGVRQAAATSLGQIGDPRSAPHLAAMAEREPVSSALAAALLALGRVGDQTHAAFLSHVATGHPIASVRAAAVTGLGDLGGAAARATARRLILHPGLPDPDWSLRSAAMLALAKCGRPEDVAEARTAFRTGRGVEHWFARSALARLVAAKDPDPLPLLRRFVGDPDPRVAVTAAEGLARAGHEDELLRLLNHLVPSIRATAATAVGQARVERGYSRLRELARMDRAREVRWAATTALFRLEDPVADELVIAAIGAREPAIWAEALALLAARTGERHGRDAKAWRQALARWRARR